jgi:hypothetical protein
MSSHVVNSRERIGACPVAAYRGHKFPLKIAVARFRDLRKVRFKRLGEVVYVQIFRSASP